MRIPMPTTQAGRAQLRTLLIRETFPRLYSPYRPHVPTALIICALLVAMVVVVSGHVLKAPYALLAISSSTSSSNRTRTSGSEPKRKDREKKKDKEDRDAARMTPWVMDEIKHRQAEKDDPDRTLARVAKDAERERTKLKGVQEKVGKKEFEEYRDGKARERAEEIEVLRRQLAKLELPMVGIPEKNEKSEADRGKGDAGGGGGAAAVSDLGRLKNTVSGWLGLDKAKEPKDPQEEKPKVPAKAKMKQFLSLDAYNNGSSGGGTVDQSKAKMEV